MSEGGSFFSLPHKCFSFLLCLICYNKCCCKVLHVFHDIEQIALANYDPRSWSSTIIILNPDPLKLWASFLIPISWLFILILNPDNFKPEGKSDTTVYCCVFHISGVWWKYLVRSKPFWSILSASGDCLSLSMTSLLASTQQAALFAKSRNCSDPKDDFARPTQWIADPETAGVTIRHPALISSKKAFNRAMLLRRALLHPHF